ncbi:MAG TPA: DUF3105 domain-containing protein [Candidatus Methylomirabilis sp.]|nr:DUF3105 domain-containing protein [Candidatus Methylomirabilis sp.]
MAKQEIRKQRKQEAKQQRVLQQRRADQRTLVGRVALYAAVSVVLLVSAYWAYGKLTEKITWNTVQTLPSPHIPLGTSHPPYNSDPPTSGPHTDGLARWGVHTEPIPKEMQVHNLEDGGVVINYACRDCPELVDQLKAIAGRYDRVVLAPYPGMDRKIALTAWGRIDTFDEFDDGRITKFIKAHIGIDHHSKNR